MILEYPTKYQDRRGTEFSKFISDGTTLKITLRGVEFIGHFWELTPIPEQFDKAKKLFDLNEVGELSAIHDYNTNLPANYSLSVKLPIKIVTNEDHEIDAEIDFNINPNKMEFLIDGKSYNFEKPNFEYGLSVEFTSTLKFKYVKCCINCKYSEFSPFGNQEYGDLMCFKNCKSAWENIGYTGLKETENWKYLKNRNSTQEAFWCEDFKLKK